MRGPLLALLLVAVSPLAAAGPITDGCYAGLVCVSERDSDAGCEGTVSAYDETRVTVTGWATVVGWSACQGTGGGGNAGSEGILVCTGPTACASWARYWNSNGESVCHFLGNSFLCFRPPNPGWGSVLP